MGSTADGRHEVVVVRHGATEWSRNGRHTGRTDLPLLAEGEDQARSLVPLLAGQTFALVLVSPLRRARETCDLIGFGAHAVVDDDLREWDYGDYEGITTVQIREHAPGWTVWDGTTPNGETVQEVAARADRVIARARQATGEVLLVAHGHLLRVLIARWCGLDPRAGKHFVLDTGTLNTLGYEHHYATIKALNQR
jgi:probable phosphoglycerate mutase